MLFDKARVEVIHFASIRLDSAILIRYIYMLPCDSEDLNSYRPIYVNDTLRRF